jgi:hypothetical protein
MQSSSTSFYVTRKFAYEEAVVCRTVGGILVALEHWLRTTQTAAREKICLAASPFHYE